MATNFSVKIGKISLFAFIFVALAFGNGLQYCTSYLKRFIYNDLATLCRHLVYLVQ